MWKFRTMERGSASLGTITGGHDRRITRIGRLLRRTKLDELPQFVNVLLGDMTVVGPRPEEPAIVALYTAAQRRVLEVKPGITGPVQLESGCEEDAIPEGVPADQYYIENLMERKLRRDREYLETRTAWTDIQVVLATAGFVLRSLIGRPIRRTLPSGAGHEQ
jgi:lipopolysaccharide/colanic/teichoic acid biosynthesis glycosyltransferase